jgi:hypothetical protein
MLPLLKDCSDRNNFVWCNLAQNHQEFSMHMHVKKIGISTLLVSTLFANPSVAVDTSVSIPVTEMKFVETGNGPIKAAPAYGDRFKGAYSNFIKLPGGFVSPPHIHTEDFYAAVISGVVANGKVGEQDIPLPPGSYWFQKGNEKHVTKCLSPTECVFFNTQPGKADFVISK